MNAGWPCVARSSTAIVHTDRPQLWSTSSRPAVHHSWPFQSLGHGLSINPAAAHTTKGKRGLKIANDWLAYLELNVLGFGEDFYSDTDGYGVLNYLPQRVSCPNSDYRRCNSRSGSLASWLATRWRDHVRLVFSILTATGTRTLIHTRIFYGIEYTQFGAKPARKTSYFPTVGALTGGKKSREGDDHVFSEKVSVGHNRNTGIISRPGDKNERREVFIVTLEYRPPVGGPAVTPSSMGKSWSTTDAISIRVVPKVNDILRLSSSVNLAPVQDPTIMVCTRTHPHFIYFSQGVGGCNRGGFTGWPA